VPTIDLTLKKIKRSAERHRRSLNSEILARLEAGASQLSRDPDAYSRDLRAFTAALPKINHRLVPSLKSRGRA